MKKIVSLILALCLICMCGSLVACGGQTTEQVISSAIEKTSNLDSMEAVMEFSMEMTGGGQTISIPMTYEITAQGLNSDDPTMLMRIAMSMSTQGSSYDIEMDIYTEGEWAYVSSGGIGYKMKLDDLESETGVADNTDNIMQELPEDLLNDAKFEKNDDGSQTVTVSVPDTQFEELYEEIIDSMNTTAAGGAIDDIDISDATVTITVKDGYISEYKMNFTMGMDIEGTSVETKASASITYKDPGTKVTVTPPEGYQSFEEMSGLG